MLAADNAAMLRSVPAFGGSYRSDDLCATAACEPRPYRAFGARSQNKLSTGGERIRSRRRLSLRQTYGRLGSSINVEAVDDLDDGPYNPDCMPALLPRPAAMAMTELFHDAAYRCSWTIRRVDKKRDLAAPIKPLSCDRVSKCIYYWCDVIALALDFGCVGQTTPCFPLGAGHLHLQDVASVVLRTTVDTCLIAGVGSNNDRGGPLNSIAIRGVQRTGLQPAVQHRPSMRPTRRLGRAPAPRARGPPPALRASSPPRSTRMASRLPGPDRSSHEIVAEADTIDGFDMVVDPCTSASGTGLPLFLRHAVEANEAPPLP